MIIYRLDRYSKKVKNIEGSTIVNGKTRYDSKLRLTFTDNKIVIRNLNANDLVAPKNSRDLVHSVTFLEEKRPEMLALKYYNDARLYWVILGANGLREREQLKKGMLIRIPAYISLFREDGLLNR